MTAPINRSVGPLPTPEHPDAYKSFPPRSALAATHSMLQAAFGAHQAGDLATAESTYRALLQTADAAKLDRFDLRALAARYHLAMICRTTGRYAEGADLLDPLRRTDDGKLFADPGIHEAYGELRALQHQQMIAAGDWGPQQATVVSNKVVFEPQALSLLREGARSALDLAALVMDAGVRASLPDAVSRTYGRLALFSAEKARAEFGKQAAIMQQSYTTGDPEPDKRWADWLVERQAEMKTLGER